MAACLMQFNPQLPVKKMTGLAGSLLFNISYKSQGCPISIGFHQIANAIGI
jgi:hypothetical protein